MTGRRLDAELVVRGLARSRGQARELIDAGAVLVAGHPATKAAHPVDDATAITLAREPDGWVGRAALKLLAALERWGPPDAPTPRLTERASGSELGGIRQLDPRGKRCLDVGASTGGFTQVLLAHGAAHVTALDVGHGQLVPALAADERVRDLPGTNIRVVEAGGLGDPFDVIVADLSFISLTIALPAMLPLLAADGDLVALVKPQFEVGRERLGRGGVVRSAHEHRRVLHDVRDVATGLGLVLLGAAPSPIAGAEGNREFLFWLGRPAPGAQPPARPVDNDMLDAIANQVTTEGAT